MDSRTRRARVLERGMVPSCICSAPRAAGRKRRSFTLDGGRRIWRFRHRRVKTSNLGSVWARIVDAPQLSVLGTTPSRVVGRRKARDASCLLSWGLLSSTTQRSETKPPETPTRQKTFRSNVSLVLPHARPMDQLPYVDRT